VDSGGALAEAASLELSSGSVLGLYPTKAFGLCVEGWCALKKRNLHFSENKTTFEQCHLQVSSAMMSSPSPINEVQNLHGNLHYIGDAAFLTL